MGVFDISTEIIAGILIAGAFAMCIRSILSFTNEATDLRPKLSKIEHGLSSLKDGMKGRKAKVAKLNEVVSPLKNHEAEMRAYYEQMKKIDLDDEKKQLAEQAEADNKRQRRIQRKKMGFDEEEDEEGEVV